jgi:outer membrane protein OmpA-like peptidoglycan-associated protein
VTANLLRLAQEALGGDFSRLAGQFLGESQGSIRYALASLLPAVIGGLAQEGATPQGASGLTSLIDGAKRDASSLGNIAGIFGGGGAGVNALLKAGTSSLVPGLFGDKAGAMVNALSLASGMKSSSATSLLQMVVPLVMVFLKKFAGDKGLNTSSLSSLLASQGPNLQGVLDSRMSSALGFASPAALVGSLGNQAGETAKRAGAAIASGAGTAGSAAAAATTATKSGLMRWLPWVIGTAVVLFLCNQITGSSTPTPALAPPAAAAVPAAATAALPAKLYFDVGVATLGAEGSNTLGAVADLIKKNGLKVTVTGYTDRTGDLANDEALAKSRSVAVVDALKAAGLADASLQLKPPMVVEIGAAGGDAEARRVEIGKAIVPLDPQ